MRRSRTHAQMYNIAVRREADTFDEHASEVERAAPGNVGESGDLDGLVQMRQDIVPEPIEYVLA